MSKGEKKTQAVEGGQKTVRRKKKKLKIIIPVVIIIMVVFIAGKALSGGQDRRCAAVF